MPIQMSRRWFPATSQRHPVGRAGHIAEQVRRVLECGIGKTGEAVNEFEDIPRWRQLADLSFLRSPLPHQLGGGSGHAVAASPRFSAVAGQRESPATPEHGLLGPTLTLDLGTGFDAIKP